MLDLGECTLQQSRSRFYFADLGGSEQLSKSKVEAAKARCMSFARGDKALLHAGLYMTLHDP